MEAQLRMYTVKPGALAAFVEEWRRRVVPLRERHGFRVLSAWASPAEDRFVWMVGSDGDGSFAERESVYYADPARSEMDPDPGRHLEKVETQMLRPVDAAG